MGKMCTRGDVPAEHAAAGTVRYLLCMASSWRRTGIDVVDAD